MNQPATRRILIFGNSGSGKSTLARRYGEEGLAVLDLDTVAYQRHAVRHELDTSWELMRAFMDAHPEGWVMEGCYGALIERAAPSASELVFLDPGVETCLAHNEARPWEPHKYASKDEQDAALAFLRSWVRDYYVRDDECSLSWHARVYAAFSGPKRRLGARARAE